MTYVEEQPDPTPVEGPDIWDLVIADMRGRHAEGIRRYGVPLRAGNGRDALVDAYQEALDLCVYLRQAIAEREGFRLSPRDWARQRQLIENAILHYSPRDAVSRIDEILRTGR